MGKTIVYLRVSTGGQDNGKFHDAVDAFCRYKALPAVEYLEEKVSGTISWRSRAIWGALNDPDVTAIVVPELSRLARSAPQLLEISSHVKERGIILYSIKEGLEISREQSAASKMFFTILSAVVEMERDLISERTKEALAAKKAQGMELGRPRGRGKSRLDVHADDIKASLQLGIPQVKIARKYGVSPLTLSNWIKKAIS